MGKRDILRIEHIRKVYADKSKNNEHVVLGDINLRVKEKEMVCLVGPSGCGKTTLLTIVAGFFAGRKGQHLY